MEKAILYGSRAKGNYKKGSDIDLTLRGSADLTLNLLYRILDDLDELLLPYTIDLSILENIDDPALIVSYSSQAALADESRPLDCAHCGEWEVASAQPSGAVGERIVIGPESVTFPTCGQFRSTLAAQSMSVDQDGHRKYRSSLTLQPLMADRLCDVPSDTTLRMEVEAGVGYVKDGGIADFRIYKGDDANPTLTAEAWNYARDNPCESGSGLGSAACMEIANARTYKALAQEAYEAHTMVPPRMSSRMARQFNVASFAAITLEFCVRREANSGGGHWPYVWALSCQNKRFQTKLDELRAWRACIAKSKSTCRFPTEKFDKSTPKEKQ